jgi:hypothetical protein
MYMEMMEMEKVTSQITLQDMLLMEELSYKQLFILPLSR